MTDWFIPHPLDDFSDYSDYWKKRKKSDDVCVNFYTVKDLVECSDYIVDVGCGLDRDFMIEVKINYPDKRIIGVDIIDGTDIINCDLSKRKLTISDMPVVADLVTAFFVLEHVQDAEKMLRNICHISRKYVVIAIPNMSFLMYKIRFLLGSFPVSNVIFHMKEHIRFWTVKDFHYLIDTQFPEWEIIEEKSGFNERAWSRIYPQLLSNSMYYVLRKKE